MSADQEQDTSKVVTLRSQVAQFWAPSGPYFSSTMIFEPVEEALRLKIFDSDGSLINEATVQFPSKQVGVLELDPLMAACKMESGMKHGRLEVHSASMVTVLCRLHSKDAAAITREALPFSAARKISVPVTFGEGRSCLLALLNKHEHSVEVRGRLFAGNRAPEATWSIPAHGVRLVDAVADFSSFVESNEEQRVAYLRLSVVGDHEVNVEVLESSTSPKQSRSFCVIS